MLCVQQAINNTRKNNTQQIAVAHLITLGDIFIVSNADERARERRIIIKFMRDH